VRLSQEMLTKIHTRAENHETFSCESWDGKASRAPKCRPCRRPEIRTYLVTFRYQTQILRRSVASICYLSDFNWKFSNRATDLSDTDGGSAALSSQTSSGRRDRRQPRWQPLSDSEFEYSPLIKRPNDPRMPEFTAEHDCISS
jgi:hypothetical protein